jgi:hypothetical protein
MALRKPWNFVYKLPLPDGSLFPRPSGVYSGTAFAVCFAWRSCSAPILSSRGPPVPYRLVELRGEEGFFSSPSDVPRLIHKFCRGGEAERHHGNEITSGVEIRIVPAELTPSIVVSISSRRSSYLDNLHKD